MPDKELSDQISVEIDKEAERDRPARDDEYWSRDSSINEFSLETFLLEYSPTGVIDIKAVNLTELDFAEFNLTEWLEIYNLTDRFSYWIQVFGNGTDRNTKYDTNEFNLNEYIQIGGYSGFG